MQNNNHHIWTPSGTDIEERWVKYYGWVRPSEQPEYKAKFKYYQELPLRRLNSDEINDYESKLRKANVVRIK